MKTQKTVLTILTLVFFTSLGVSQEAIEKEVNEQVWKPFVESWTSNDHVAFNALHTDDVLRASAGGIRLGKEYKERNTEAMSRNTESEAERSIQFWLEHRVYSGDTGYEVGYYKVAYKQPGKEVQHFYARFHIVLKKIDGVWKIAQDWDTNNVNGRPVTEEDWQKGKPLDL